MPPRDSDLWPARCDHCDYLFVPEDQFQVFPATLYSAPECGVIELKRAPPGAMWWMTWWGADKLAVMTPGGEWHVDGRASNCTMPTDYAHRCWVRHGTPPNITVDKQGHTCAAGAGSIVAGSYHGFLRNGYLEQA